MRKYDLKNKRNFIIVASIGIIIIIIFSLFVKKVIEASKIEYVIASGSTLQDINKNEILLENDALLKIKWNNEYYLINDDEQIEIGKNVIVYNTNNNQLNLYGKFYEITEDEKVVVTEKETIIKTSLFSKFYKIADRKYLIVDREIASQDKILATNNYLIVELDKLGNATLTNHEVDYKTFAPTIITTREFTFDIANEKINFGEKDIDLKKIIGSTNDYKPATKEEEGTGDGTGSGTGTGTGDGTGRPDTYVDPNTGLETNQGSGSNTTIEDLIDIAKKTSVISVVPSINTIDIDYVIYDAKDEYTSVFVEIKNTKTSAISVVYLSKLNTRYTLTNLSLDTTYELTFRYSYYDETSTLRTDTFESVRVTTLTPKISLNVSRTTMKYIHFDLILDDNYPFNSVNVELYSDNTLLTTKTLTNVSGKTITSSFNIEEYELGNVITLKVANVYYNGSLVNIQASYKYKN